MKEPLDLSYGLLTKAAHDLRAAEIGIENEAPLDTVAFHLQQCAEKLIKAFLNWKLVQYPKTHALGALLDLAVPHQPDLESFRSRLLPWAHMPSRCDMTMNCTQRMKRFRSVSRLRASSSRKSYR